MASYLPTSHAPSFPPPPSFSYPQQRCSGHSPHAGCYGEVLPLPPPTAPQRESEENPPQGEGEGGGSMVCVCVVNILRLHYCLTLATGAQAGYQHLHRGDHWREYWTNVSYLFTVLQFIVYVTVVRFLPLLSFILYAIMVVPLQCPS